MFVVYFESVNKEPQHRVRGLAKLRCVRSSFEYHSCTSHARRPIAGRPCVLQIGHLFCMSTPSLEPSSHPYPCVARFIN